MPPTAAHAPSAAPSVVARVKQTFACEPCRKRKAKCSGDAPCLMCQRTGQTCEFIYTRQRRGRKSKALDNDTNPPQPPHRSPSPPAVLGDLLPPVTPSWPPQLQACLQSDLTSHAAVQDHGHDAHALAPLVLHLLDVFFTIVARQYPLFVYKSHLHLLVSENRCPGHLCYALATAALPWSGHASLQDRHARSQLQHLLVTLVRKQLQFISSLDDVLPVLQSYCATILHETSQGSAIRAWSDLGAATNLVRLLPMQDSNQSVPSEPALLVSDFLSASHVWLSLGHPGLSVLPHKHYRLENTDAMFGLCRMCSLLAQVETETRLGFSDHLFPPWLSDSPFMSLRQSLDRARLAWPETLSFELEEGRASQDWLAIAVWHACVILLNNVFLPIPAVGPPIDSVTDEAEFASHPARILLSFPRAPGRFLEERITACEASAVQVANICRHIMYRGLSLLAPLLGYSCYQAALVFLHQLQVSRPSVSPEIVMRLKTVFTMLGAIRISFKPAHAWIETIMAIHALPTLRIDPSKDLEKVFKGFSARFPGVGMTPFVSFQATDQADQGQEHTNKRGPPHPTQRADQTSEEAFQPDWITTYASQLDNDLAPDDLAEPIQPNAVEDPSASYETAFQALSHPIEAAQPHFVDADMSFADDEWLQEMLGDLDVTAYPSERFLVDSLARGADLLQFPMDHSSFDN